MPNDTQSFENERFVVNVFPNPTTDTFRISIENLKLNASLNLRISDPTGRVVFEEKYGKMDGHFKGDFSKKNLGLGNGIHFLTLESDGVSRVITLK